MDRSYQYMCGSNTHTLAGQVTNESLKVPLHNNNKTIK